MVAHGQVAKLELEEQLQVAKLAWDDLASAAGVQPGNRQVSEKLREVEVADFVLMCNKLCDSSCGFSAEMDKG